MRLLIRLFGFGLVLAGTSGIGQTANKDGWGPWRYTDFKTSGIEFRSRCISNSGPDSRWELQFRSRHNQTVDFAWRAEHKVENSQKNEFDKRKRLTLDGGEMSPLYETQIYGTCDDVRELKIEVLCNTVPGLDAPCYKDPEARHSEDIFVQ